MFGADGSRRGSKIGQRLAAVRLWMSLTGVFRYASSSTGSFDSEAISRNS